MASATATDSDGRILLPNFVVAKLYAKRQDGRKVYMTCTGSLVCEHGETAGTITYWTAMEARARAEGRSPPKRGRAGVSVCDCQSSAGLVCRSINTSMHPEAPPSLYAFLESKGEDEITVRGVSARRLPHLEGPTYLTATGKLVCKHGNSKRALITKARARCDCKLGRLPLRNSLPHGKFSSKFELVCADIENVSIP